MKKKIILIACFLVLLTITVYSAFVMFSPQTDFGQHRGSFKFKEVVINDSSLNNTVIGIEEAIRYKNLQIFPLTGSFGIKDKTYVTLQEAMERKLVEVDETSNVSELSLTNLSDEYVFILSGDIVKGGKQDRTLQYDIIVAPKERKLPLASFCVEQGRWSQRGAENVDGFAVSHYNTSSRDLKVSAKKMRNQGEVWKRVRVQKEKFQANISEINDTVYSFANASETSLQLALEDSALIKIREEYNQAFSQLQSVDNLVGLAYAINGEVYGIDVFNNKLVYDLRKKMVDAFVNEAISDRDSTKLDLTASVEDVNALLQKPDAKADMHKSEEVNSETIFETQVYGKINRFITYDAGLNTWLHLNVIRESDEMEIDKVPDHNNIYIEDRGRRR
jgi:hypothetical protein